VLILTIVNFSVAVPGLDQPSLPYANEYSWKLRGRWANRLVYSFHTSYRIPSRSRWCGRADFANTVFVEGGADFPRCGITLPDPSWGNMINEGQTATCNIRRGLFLCQPSLFDYNTGLSAGDARACLLSAYFRSGTILCLEQ